MSLNELSPFLAGPVIGAGSLLLAYLAYRRGSRADAAAQENSANAQVYAGYGGLLQRIQEDNADLRSQVIELRERLAAAEERIALLLH